MPIGTSKGLAKDVLTKKLAEATEMRYFPARAANQKLFSEVLNSYWELHGKNLESRSWIYTVNELRKEFGSAKIGAVGAVGIQRWYNKVVAYSSAASANKKLNLIKSIFNKAKVWGYFYGDNPCLQVKKLTVVSARHRYLHQHEIKRLVEVSHPRLRPVVVCALLTGMRKSEILRLSWENIDLERGVIHIRKAKSGRAREIPVANSLREVLAILPGERRGNTFELPEIMLRRFFVQALKDAAIENFRFHDLRHTFASHYLMKTGDLPTLQNLLGHSTPLLTMRYAHLSQAHVRSGMEKFEVGMIESRPMPVIGLCLIRRCKSEARAYNGCC